MQSILRAMKILVLAPHPFYEERGTPIAVNLLLRLFSQQGHHVDLLTFHVGQDMHYDNLTILRTPKLGFIKTIRPGLSWKKVVCDVVMLFKLFGVVRRRRPDVLHAVEESVFMAMAIKLFFRIPYVYDMDSSLASNIRESHSYLFFLQPFFRWMEGAAVNHALAVLPVCPALVDVVEKHKPKRVWLITDTSLLDPNETPTDLKLRESLNARGPVFMYIGNLEPYQGIDLLLESFQRVCNRSEDGCIIVVGGMPHFIETYEEKSRTLGIADRVYFVGAKPTNLMAALFNEADILVSPRFKGENTPMKLYSYLDSGKAVLATALHTHTQIVDDTTAKLADPTPEAFAQAMLELIQSPQEREQLGRNGKQCIAEHYSVETMDTRVRELYAYIQTELKHAT